MAEVNEQTRVKFPFFLHIVRKYSHSNQSSQIALPHVNDFRQTPSVLSLKTSPRRQWLLQKLPPTDVGNDLDIKLKGLKWTFSHLATEFMLSAFQSQNI